MRQNASLFHGHAVSRGVSCTGVPLVILSWFGPLLRSPLFLAPVLCLCIAFALSLASAVSLASRVAPSLLLVYVGFGHAREHRLEDGAVCFG